MTLQAPVTRPVSGQLRSDNQMVVEGALHAVSAAPAWLQSPRLADYVAGTGLRGAAGAAEGC